VGLAQQPGRTAACPTRYAPGVFDFVWRISARDQLWASLLAIAVVTLNTAPLAMQRRILNAAVLDGDVMLVVMLAAVYGAIVLSEGVVKMAMNMTAVPRGRVRAQADRKRGPIERHIAHRHEAEQRPVSDEQRGRDSGDHARAQVHEEQPCCGIDDGDALQHAAQADVRPHLGEPAMGENPEQEDQGRLRQDSSHGRCATVLRDDVRQREHRRHAHDEYEWREDQVVAGSPAQSG
jgi:hypothetical protein